MNRPHTPESLAMAVDTELRQIVESRKVPLYDMMAYHMGWEGENGSRSSSRMRGALCLLANAAFGGDVESALPAAAAVELVHNFTLIHDDVQSGSPQRDGRDAVWWVWGPAQAINAGDGMHALARLALFKLVERGVTPDLTFKAVQVMDECSLAACEGRFMDLEAQERIDVVVSTYMSMAEAKTGSLLACALRLGALVASPDDNLNAEMKECGTNLGVAMQIRSDLRALWPAVDDQSSLAPDVLNKKKLLPVVYAFERAEVGHKRRLGDVYFKRVLDTDDVVQVRSLLESIGVRDWCESQAETYQAQSLEALDRAGITGDDPLRRYVQQIASEPI